MTTTTMLEESAVVDTTITVVLIWVAALFAFTFAVCLAAAWGIREHRRFLALAPVTSRWGSQRLEIPVAVRSALKLAPWDDDPFGDGEDSSVDGHDPAGDEEYVHGRHAAAGPPLPPLPPPAPQPGPVPEPPWGPCLTQLMRVARRNDRYVPLHRYEDLVRAGDRT